MTRVSSTRFLSLALLAALAACSGGGGTTGGLKTGGDFIVLSTEPSDNAQLYLNDPIAIDFSNPVDLSTVDLTTFSFQVYDQIGTAIAEPVAGHFELGTSPGDDEPGRRLLFVPVLPTNDLYTNGGFRPGRTYEVQLVGGNANNNTVIRDVGGKPLARPQSFRFSTSDGTTPGQLFRNVAPGGPRLVSFEVTPSPDVTSADPGVVLNKLGNAPVEVRLQFDQPLNPASTNVPVAVETDPLLRNSSNRGRVFLEYNDVLGDNTWIPADVELESNAIDGSVLVLRPLGVLPNNARDDGRIRVIVEKTLEDISGESNVANVAYVREVASFATKQAFEQQFDALVDDFLTSANIDLTAAFSEPTAEVGPGYLKAGFDFGGTVTGAEFEPTAPLTVLNTDFTLVTPKNGAPFNVSGGVFNFRNVMIPQGKTVQGQGSNPMVWLVSGTFEVAGTLSVRGGDGERVTTSGNANVPKDGGAGVCGGGDGGDGSPSTVQRDLAGGNGNGPLNVADLGGQGGALSCTAGCNRGAGGGGGSLATQGDPNYKQKVQPVGSANPVNPFAIFPQQTGVGGNGCVGNAGTVTRSLDGGVPGPTVFVDARRDNDYWGVGVRYDTNLRIVGELATPLGGGGGGGGGDMSYNSDCGVDDPNFENDSSGGGGGGGGGVLIVKCLGPIIIRDTGTITADGGSGGGGEPSASSTRGGGGGAGSGGMVVLMSAERIEINARGAGSSYGYGDNNYDFAISADGGACVTGNTPPIVSGKYPASGTAIQTAFATTYDSVPLGGFGGMGIVQLMVPPGDPANNVDGTNTVLDDNIDVLVGGILVAGQQKQDLLAWRGFPNAFGQGVDDAGNVITPPHADNDGEIRPAPVLLPTPFSNKSRLRSRWIDTGATARRGLVAADPFPRGIVEQGGAQRGPKFEWLGVNDQPGSVALGYANYVVSQGLANTVYPQVIPASGSGGVAIQNRNANASFLGRPAYRIVLAQPAMGTTDDRYVHYEAELLDASGALLGSYRILSHTASELVLSPEGGPLEVAATQARVVAKFFKIVTNGVEGLGSTYAGGQGGRVPVANIRFGFAFHQNPQDPNAQRYPATPGTFAYDLSDPAVQEAVRALGAPFVQWDILFDTAFRSNAQDVPPALNPETPLPELHFLRLPFRF